jgi:hypothetical protein
MVRSESQPSTRNLTHGLESCSNCLIVTDIKLPCNSGSRTCGSSGFMVKEWLVLDLPNSVVANSLFWTDIGWVVLYVGVDGDVCKGSAVLGLG